MKAVKDNSPINGEDGERHALKPWKETVQIVASEYMYVGFHYTR